MKTKRLKIKATNTHKKITALILTLLVSILVALFIPTFALAAEAEPISQASDTVGMFAQNEASQLSAEERLNFRLIAGVASIVLAAIIAGAVIMKWTQDLKSVKKRDSACDYVKRESFALTIQRDIFLYRNIRRIPRRQDTGSRGGRGGYGGGYRVGR